MHHRGPAAWAITRKRSLDVPEGWTGEIVDGEVVANPRPAAPRDDRTKKLPLYARHNVRHVWLLDAIAQTLEVYRLDGDLWRLAQTFGGDAKVRAEPFELIEIDLTLLWGPTRTGDE